MGHSPETTGYFVLINLEILQLYVFLRSIVNMYLPRPELGMWWVHQMAKDMQLWQRFIDNG